MADIVTAYQFPIARKLRFGSGSKDTKHFPGVITLDGVDFDLRPGEVHVLFGETVPANPPRSRLSPCLANDGRIDSAARRSIASVHQRVSVASAPCFGILLVPQLTVEENLFLGAEITAESSSTARHPRKGARNSRPPDLR